MKPQKPDARVTFYRGGRSESRANLSEHDGTDGTTKKGRRSGGHVHMTDAAELMERMQRRTEERQQVEARLGEREEWIKTHYANFSDIEPFNKDARLADLITETKASFLKLDRELSEDHNIATRRLHSSVFTHATDFLHLFRDVNRASTLVESLKGRVMGTKAAISAISKFSTHNNSNQFGSHSFAEVFDPSLLHNSTTSGTSARVYARNCSSSNVGGGSGMNHAVKARTRPSLIVMQLTRRGNTTADNFSSKPRRTKMDSSLHNINNNYSGDGGITSSGSIYLSATTRSLNTPSVRLWRETTLSGGCGGGRPVSLQRYLQSQLDADRNSGVPSAQDIMLFADVLKEEVMQVVAGRRYVEAAELLRGVEKEAVAKGCLPLLLSLEAALVNAIETQLHSLPMPFMYSESLHIPLIQLLLRFGRVLSGTQLFFQLHAAWVDAEIDKLQQRMGPFHSALIASDFLVGAVQEVLERQQHLWHSVSSTLEVNDKNNNNNNVDGDGDDEGKSKTVNKTVPKYLQDFTTTTTTIDEHNNNNRKKNTNNNGSSRNNNNNNNNNRSGNVSISRSNNSKNNGTNTNDNGQPISSTMPPSSTAVLWVRNRVDKLAREVLESRALSYGIGAEGGDPSRFQRAVMMAADAICTLRRMNDSGYAGCETHLLRLLTPSLVYLQVDFVTCTETRLENTGKAMIDHLLQDVRHVYKSRKATYNPKMCEEVARRSNYDCRELRDRLKALPRTSYALLLELLLAPASCSLFVAHKNSGGNSSSSFNTLSSSSPGLNQPMKMLPPNKYIFLRYVNGCTRVHGLFLSSLIRFVASMMGRDSLPLEHSEQQQQQQQVREGEMMGNRLECVSLLFSNALVIESLDTTLQHLFFALLRTTLRQRQTLVTFLCSAEFANMRRQLSLVGDELTSSFSISTRWLLGAMQLLLADVLSASVWVAFLSRGGALPYMLCDTALTFSSQYLEELRRVLPFIVQGWMVATLSLGHNVDAARNLLVVDSAMPLDERDVITSDCDNNNNSTTTTTTTTTAAAVMSYMKDGSCSYIAISQLVQTAAVKEDQLMPFLFSLVRRQFTAHTGDEREAMLLCTPPFSSSSSISESPVWNLRGTLGNYPQFPIGGNIDHNNELFLFHWCVQISLNTLAFFQECLLLPSHVVNGRWAMEHKTTDISTTTTNDNNTTGGVQYPLCGCVSPHEESVLGMLAAGGGNYVSSVAILQFIIFRLLRDVLCCAETWTSVYGLPRDQWSRSKSILRQQLFFFALFVRLWSPLFVGAMETTLQGRPITTNQNENIDGLPALVILQWLTCMSNDRQQLGEKEGHKKRRCSLDVEDLAFSLDTASLSSRMPTAQVPSIWTSQRGSSQKNTNNPQAWKEGKISSSFLKASGAGASHNSSNISATNYSGDDTKGNSELSVLLLDVIGSFFDLLEEPRAIPAIISEVTMSRVEKLITAVNLIDFVGKKGLDEDDDDEDEEEEDEEEDDEEDDDDSSESEDEGYTKRSSLPVKSLKKSVEVTLGSVALLHVHNLLVHYLTPLL